MSENTTKVENKTTDKKEKKDMKEIIRAVKFAIVSMSAGIVELGVFTLMNEFSGLKYWPCYLTALIASVVWCYTVNRRYTFKSGKPIPVVLAYAAAFYAVFTPATTVLGNYLAETLLWNEYLVTIINMTINLVTEYLYDTYVVYRNNMDNNSIAEKEKKKAAEELEK